jgi:hypothetical protein
MDAPIAPSDCSATVSIISNNKPGSGQGDHLHAPAPDVLPPDLSVPYCTPWLLVIAPTRCLSNAIYTLLAPQVTIAIIVHDTAVVKR